jgi:hypothetical protein
MYHRSHAACAWRDIIEIQLRWQRGEISAAETRALGVARLEEMGREIEQDTIALHTIENEIHPEGD